VVFYGSLKPFVRLSYFPVSFCSSVDAVDLLLFLQLECLESSDGSSPGGVLFLCSREDFWLSLPPFPSFSFRLSTAKLDFPIGFLFFDPVGIHECFLRPKCGELFLQTRPSGVLSPECFSPLTLDPACFFVQRSLVSKKGHPTGIDVPPRLLMLK